MKMKLQLTAVCCAAMCFALTGCGTAEESEPAVTAELSETAQTTTVSQTETTAAFSTETTAAPAPESNFTYMERHRAKLTAMPPEEILAEREGVVYPEFQKYYYYSQTAQRDTGVNVLLPVGYSEEREYPVLYVLHGSEDNEDWMTQEDIHLRTMLTNLIADGDAKEMIVVSPYIYCSADTPVKGPGIYAQDLINFDQFMTDLMTDLKPFIEENFSVAKGRENTAITGFSIGGRESLGIGFSYPEQFGFIGSICAASGVVAGTNDIYILEEDEFCFRDDPPELLLMSASDHDAAVGDMPYQYDRMLTENGTEHLFHEMTASAHDVGSVTAHLYNFLRMIFL